MALIKWLHSLVFSDKDDKASARSLNHLMTCFDHNRAPVAQLVEHRAIMREVESSTPAGPTLTVLK